MSLTAGIYLVIFLFLYFSQLRITVHFFKKSPDSFKLKICPERKLHNTYEKLALNSIVENNHLENNRESEETISNLRDLNQYQRNTFINNLINDDYS